MTNEMGWIQERRSTTNREREAPQREKAHAFQVGSGRGHDWQRPLPMMAANAATNGSGRCQPKFASDDAYREMVIRNHPTPRARPLVAYYQRDARRGNERPEVEPRPLIGYMLIIINEYTPKTLLH